MATKYPSQIDTGLTLPPAIDNVTGVDAVSVNQLQGAIIAIETTAGVKPQGLYTTIRARLDAIEALIQNAIVGDFTPSGDLSGSQIHQTVIGLQTNPLAPGVLGPTQDGYVLTWVNSSFQWIAKPLGFSGTLAGDVTGSLEANTVVNVHGASVPVSGSLTTGNVLQVSGVSALSYGPINLAGGSNYVTGVLPIGNQASQTMGGDVTGTTAASVVAKIHGNPVTAQTLNSTTDGYVLTWDNADGYWKALPDSDPIAAITQLTNDVLAGPGSGSVAATVVKLQHNPITAQTLNSSTDGYVLTWDNADGYWKALPESSSAITLSGDVVGLATANTITSFSKLNVVTLEKYGAVGDGVTNDSAAMTSALAAVAGGGTIQLGSNKTYLIGASSPYSIPTGVTIVGYGDGSILKTATNAALLSIGGENVTIASLRIIGNSTGSAQYGIANAIPGNTQYPLCRIHDVSLDSLGEAAIILDDAISVGPPPLFSTSLNDIRITNCPTFGLWNVANYTTVTNIQIDNCGEGIRCQTGNQVYTGGSITDCTTGFHLVGGGNDGHGEVVGMLINHNTTNFLADNTVANGMPIVGCSFYGAATAISLVGSHGVRFIGCTFDVDNYYFDGSIGTLFDGCLFPQNAGTNIIHNNFNSHASTTRWSSNNVDLNGNYPGFIIGGGDGTNWQHSFDGYMTINQNISTPKLTYLAALSDVATHNFTVQGQYAFASATGTNRAPGNLVFDIGAPTNSGTTEAAFQFTRNGTVIGELSVAQNSIPTYGALWLGTTNPGGTTNWAIRSDGTGSTYVNAEGSGAVGFTTAASNFQFYISSNIAYFGNSTGIAPVIVDWSTSTTPMIHSGTSATSLTVGTNKISATLGLYSDLNNLSMLFDWRNGVTTMYDANLVFDASMTAPTFKQNISTTGNGQPLVIRAQDGYVTHPANGGNLYLEGGAKNSTGIDGYVAFLPGGIMQARITSASALTGSGAGYVAVDDTGLLSFAATASPGGSAGGDLSGSYPNPTVVALQGKSLNSSLASLGAPQDGYILTWDNSDGYWRALPTSSTIVDGQDFAFSNTSSDVSGYDQLFDNATGSEADLSAAVTSGGGTVLIKAFASVASSPDVELIPAGLWEFNFYAYASLTGAFTTQLVFDVYTRTAGGAETLLFSAVSGSLNITSVGLFTLLYNNPNDTYIANTTRLVIKVSAKTSSVLSVTAHFVFDGTTHASLVRSPIAGAAIQLGGDLTGTTANAIVVQAQGGKVLFDSVHGRVTAGGSGSDVTTALGPMVGSETTIGGLWLASGGALSNSNWQIQYNSNLTFRAAGGWDLAWNSGGTLYSIAGSMSFGTNFAGGTLTLSAGAGTSMLTLSTTSLSVPVNVGAFTYTMVPRATDAATSNLTIQGQYAFASATVANRTPGNLVFDIGAPTNGSTTEGFFQFTRNGTQIGQFGLLNTSQFGWWNGATTPTAQNVTLLSDATNSFVYVNTSAGGAIGLINNDSTFMYYTVGTSAFWGGTSTAAPLQASWSTSTTPFFQSGTAATALTIGTQKNAATLAFQADNAVTCVTLSGSSSSSAGTGNTSVVGSIQNTYRSVSGNVTVDTTTTDNRIRVTATQTSTLPAPTAGRCLRFIIDGYAGSDIIWTLAQHASEKLNNNAGSYIVTIPANQVAKFDVESFDGTNWLIFD